MTSDRTPEGPQDGRPPANRSKRVDQGDLWDDNATDAAPASRVARPKTPSAPAPTPPAQTPPPASTPARSTPAAASRARAATPAPRTAPPPPVDDPYEDEYEEPYYEEGSPSLLSNPYMLAGLAVAGAIILAVIVVFFFGRGGTDEAPPPTTTGATGAATATPDGDSPSATGLLARSIAVATVREGPGLNQLELGLLQSEQDVDVVGRNDDATWFQIVFPFGTALRGWVPETALRLPDNVTALVDVTEMTPVARPTIAEPTATEAPIEETSTPEGQGGADLAVFISSDCTPGEPISLTVSNAGDVELIEEPIEVTVANQGDVVYQESFEAKMEVGASASVTTDAEATAPSMLVSVVLTAVEDVNPGNNSASCAVEGGGNNNNNDDEDNDNDPDGSDNVPPPVATQNAQ